MLATFLTVILLYCNATPVLSDCPKAQQWMNKTISPGGPLVCAKLYADDKCAGFPLPFGINSSSSDLGTASSSLVDFQGNSVTALVRPGCNMYLWEGANFTGDHQSSTSYTWNVGQKHYRSAVCNCSIEDPELLQCEMRENWELIKSCNFFSSDSGGLCSLTLELSYFENKNGVAENVTIKEQIFTDKIAQSFGEQRMAEFLDLNHANDLMKYTVFIEAMNWIMFFQRSYVCGKYHLFTPEIMRKSVLGPLGWFQNMLKNDKWIYNPHSNSYFWFSIDVGNRALAKTKCGELGGHLATIDTIELRKWVEPFMAPSSLIHGLSGNWWTGLIPHEDIGINFMNETCYYKFEWEDNKLSQSFYIQEACKNDGRDCVALSSDKKFGLYKWERYSCDSLYNYICEKEHIV